MTSIKFNGGSSVVKSAYKVKFVGRERQSGCDSMTRRVSSFATGFSIIIVSASVISTKKHKPSSEIEVVMPELYKSSKLTDVSRTILHSISS